MSIYPDNFCIKCKKHTSTLGKHTVTLPNRRRVLKGICPLCSSETYRFMPKQNKSRHSQISLIKERKSKEISEAANKPLETGKEIPVYSSPVRQTSFINKLDFVLGQRMSWLGYYLLLAGFTLLALIFTSRSF